MQKYKFLFSYIELFCKYNYLEDYDKRMQCREFHNYCKLQCDNLVFKREIQISENSSRNAGTNNVDLLLIK